MTKKDFIRRMIKHAKEDKTLYVNGGFGQNATPANKKYFIDHYGFNRSIDAYGRNRRELIENASSDTLFYDCVCLVKSTVNGDKGYTTKPCPDITIAALLRTCKDVRKISNTDLPREGDFLTNASYSHCGVYIGNGEVVECTYRDVENKGKDGVQITRYAGRGWVWAGDLEPYFDAEPAPVTKVWAVQVMANKSKSNAKKYLRKGQSTYYVDGYYKNAYVFANVGECESAIADIRKKYPDAFITNYSADALVIL